jgi:ferredoxin-NADP reductase
MTPQPSSGPWRVATVVERRAETSHAATFRLRLDAPLGQRAGQHVVLRLTAPDGYTAQRSYSVASAPEDGDEFELTVERLEGGEVSMFLHDVVEPGDELDVRGPIGGWFVWDGTTPALLLGGGSGVVPLMAMLRHARQTGRADLLRLVVSVRSPDVLYYAAELPGPQTTVVFTRSVPPGHRRAPGRLVTEDVPMPLADDVTAYVCGSAGFAEAASTVLLDAGVPAERVRVERFGPTG